MDTPQPTSRTGVVDPRLATQDAGDVNRRILDKERYRAEFNRVEEASLKVPIVLKSPDAKRLYARIYYSYQVNVHMAVRIGRTRLPADAIDQVNGELQRQMAEATKLLNDALDKAGAELEQNGITRIASYETVPLEDTVAVTSPLANRMLDLLAKLDQYMPLLSTLEILEAITESDADARRANAKKAVLGLASSALQLWFGVQRRMQEVDRLAARAKAATGQAAQPAASPARQTAGASNADAAPKPAPQRKKAVQRPVADARPPVVDGSADAASPATAATEQAAAADADATASTPAAEEAAQPA